MTVVVLAPDQVITFHLKLFLFFHRFGCDQFQCVPLSPTLVRAPLTSSSLHPAWERSFTKGPFSKIVFSFGLMSFMDWMLCTWPDYSIQGKVKETGAVASAPKQQQLFFLVLQVLNCCFSWLIVFSCLLEVLLFNKLTHRVYLPPPLLEAQHNYCQMYQLKLQKNIYFY